MGTDCILWFFINSFLFSFSIVCRINHCTLFLISVYCNFSTTDTDSIEGFVKQLTNMKVDWRLFLGDMKNLALIGGSLSNFFFCISQIICSALIIGSYTPNYSYCEQGMEAITYVLLITYTYLNYILFVNLQLKCYVFSLFQ